MWAVANPSTPIFKTGTTDGVIFAALGSFLPDGSMPGETDYGEKVEVSEQAPGYVAEKDTI